MDDQRCGERFVQRGGRINGARRGPRAPVGWVAVALATALLTASACNNVDMRIGPGIQVGTGTGSGAHHNSLVGMWTRVVVLTDNHGSAHSSRTTWEFRSDGSATRTVITQHLSSGVSDVLTANASWHTEGSTLVIIFRSPDSGSSRFGFSVFGNVLSLDGRDFVRVA